MWSREAMIQAIIAVRNNTMGVNRAEKLFNVPKTSLRRYMKMLETDPSETVRIRARRRPIIIEELERRLGIRQGRSSQNEENLIKPDVNDSDITIIDDTIAEDEDRENYDESLPNGYEPDIDLAPIETLQMPEFCVAESPQPGTSSFAADEDECSAMGRHFACQLRAMNENQRLLAQRAIADVLYFGRLGKLSENCFIFQQTHMP